MTCFPVWSTLLPFATLIRLRFPGEFQDVWKDYLEQERLRANCDFARIIGIWKRIEELDQGDQEDQSAVTNVMLSLLQFASGEGLGEMSRDIRTLRKQWACI